MDKKIGKYKFTGPTRNPPSSLQFFSDCVRYNKPCILDELAKDWPAVEKWKLFSDEGRKYFTELIGDTKVKFFEKAIEGGSAIPSRTYSFRRDYEKRISYSEFLDVQKVYPKKSNIKDDSDELKEKLLKDIKVPSFY